MNNYVNVFAHFEGNSLGKVTGSRASARHTLNEHPIYGSNVEMCFRGAALTVSSSNILAEYATYLLV